MRKIAGAGDYPANIAITFFKSKNIKLGMDVGGRISLNLQFAGFNPVDKLLHPDF